MADSKQVALEREEIEKMKNASVTEPLLLKWISIQVRLLWKDDSLQIFADSRPIINESDFYRYPDVTLKEYTGSIRNTSSFTINSVYIGNWRIR